MNHWILIALVPFVLQAMAIAVDEFVLHRRRGLPRWERWGHPLDTLSVLSVNLVAAVTSFSGNTLLVFLALCLLSCLFVTKDEWVHAHECSGFEHWLHALLFVFHPMTFVSTAFFWVLRDRPSVFAFPFETSEFASTILWGQVWVLAVFSGYQFIYWNFFRSRAFGSDVKLSLQGTQSESADRQWSA